MSQVQAFKDSANIRIKNGSAYHFVIGDTYLSRFINNLRLEQKFENDDAFEDMLINIIERKRIQPVEPENIKTYGNNYKEDTYDEYDCYIFCVYHDFDDYYDHDHDADYYNEQFWRL